MIDLAIPQFAYFKSLGLLGGFTYIHAEVTKKWSDMITFSVFRRYLIGTIVGYLYFMGYSSWDLPIGLMCVVAGYSGTHFIGALLSRFESEKKGSDRGRVFLYSNPYSGALFKYQPLPAW